MKNIFNDYLKKVSFFSWILKLIPIPIGIIIAKLGAEVTMRATEGNIEKVISNSLILLGIIIGIKVFNILTEIAYKKAVSKSVHKCKMSLYNKFLSNPLYMLYSSQYGEVMENLNDDFNSVTNKTLEVFPNFWVGIVTAASYCIFLGLQSPMIAFTLVLIAFLQIIPPLIVKKYMKVNYDNCRKIEGQITNLILEGYKGFATIKLYDLKEWWLQRMKALHKKYIRLGNMSIYTNTAESVMDILLENILKYGTYGIIGMFVLLKYTSLEVAVEAIVLSGGLYSSIKVIFALIPDLAVAQIAEKRISVWYENKEHYYDKPEGISLSLCNVSHSFNDKRILHQVDCSIDTDKICIIKGANGIGKSTFFKLISGLLKATHGTIKVGGVIPEYIEEKDFLTNIFYLPQEDTLFNFSPKELYEMVIPEKQKAAIDFAMEFGLTHKMISMSKINELSGGERKKAFLSLALALNTPILLLDEPTNSLDDHSKIILCNHLKERRGGAIIITHDYVFDSIAECVYTICEGGIYSEIAK